MEVLKNKASMRSRSSAETRTQINKMVEKLADQMKVILDEMAQNGTPLSHAPPQHPCKQHDGTPESPTIRVRKHHHKHHKSCKTRKHQHPSISPVLSSDSSAPKLSPAREPSSVECTPKSTPDKKQKHQHHQQEEEHKLAKKQNYSVCVEGLNGADGMVLCVDLSLKNIPSRDGDESAKSPKCGSKKVQMRVEMPDFEPSRVIINDVVFQKVG